MRPNLSCGTVTVSSFVAVALVPTLVLTSTGDQSIIYQKCLEHCEAQNCSDPWTLFLFKKYQPWYLMLFGWGCPEECEYACMWQTVGSFQLQGKPLPQFHGKWPFVRFLGIQEPASAVFSILNGVSHFVMWNIFSKEVPRSAPNFFLWESHAILSINAWVWSTMFHCKDTPWTEMLDYFCAFSLVLYSFYCLCIRAFGDKGQWTPTVVATTFLAFFVQHIYYLAFVHFDYGYNMAVNVSVGLLNSVGWLLWCYQHRHRRKYVWKCATCVLIINALLLLELGDFPPWNYFLDAHAMWHLGTAPVPLLWYSFLIDDCLSQMGQQSTMENRNDGGPKTTATNCHPNKLAFASYSAL